MRRVVKNIFREYNIPCDEPRKRKKVSCKKPTKPRLNTTNCNCTDVDSIIQNFSDDENLTPPSYPYIQLRRSFEIPLKLVPVSSLNRRSTDNEKMGAAEGRNKFQLFGKEATRNVGNTLTPPDEEEDSDVDCMPRPIQIKEEILSQTSEELMLSMPCSSNSTIVSSIASIAPRMRSKISSDESSISSADYIGCNSCRKTKSSLSLNGSVGVLSPKRSRKEMMTRYRPLDISITKVNSRLRSATKKGSPRRRKSRAAGKRKKPSPTKKLSPTSPTADNDLNLSWSLRDEEPFQTNSADKSFVCSSPKPSQIINTPSSTPSPRKRPTELDLMIELIEKENSMKNTTIRRSPRKSSKRCLPGGYVELYQRSLAKAKTDARFLKHDKKYGLRNGVILRILRVESSHGVHMAEVQDDSNKDAVANKFAIILPPQMVNQLQADSRIEAFFDEASSPYTLEDKNGDKRFNVFIKPYKLLLL